MLTLMAPVIPKQLHPGYRLSRLLGRGAGGEVWVAERDDGSSVALKFLPCEGGTSAARELRSIQIVRGLWHPGLVRIDEVWCGPGHLVVAMELADGSLLDLLEVYQSEFGTPVVAEHAVLLLAQAAEALDFLNARRHFVGSCRVGIQHCDIKPGNLLLFGDTVKLSDFGLTSVLASPLAPHQRAGTFPYAAPEVLRGQLSDRTDQYALAVTYCQLRGGRLPFADAPEVPWSGSAPPPDLTMLSEPEQPVVRRALAAAPVERWPSCREFIAQLEKTVL
jgi:serine/threonine protein kinase